MCGLALKVWSHSPLPPITARRAQTNRARAGPWHAPRSLARRNAVAAVTPRCKQLLHANHYQARHAYGAPRAPPHCHPASCGVCSSAWSGGTGGGQPHQRRASDRSNGTVTILQCVFNFQNGVWKSWKFAISRAPAGRPGNPQVPIQCLCFDIVPSKKWGF
jgi:hypothetical protein